MDLNLSINRCQSIIKWSNLWLIGFSSIWQEVRHCPFAEIAGLFSEIVICECFCMFCVFLKKIQIILIDNRDIFYTYLLYRHYYTNPEAVYFKGLLSCNVILSYL